MINNIREMNAAKDKAWGRTRDAAIDDLGNNSFPGQVSYPSVTRGTLDEDGVGKPLTTDGAFEKLEDKLAHEKGVTDPAGLAAKIGMEKMGKAAFEEKAKEGREHA